MSQGPHEPPRPARSESDDIHDRLVCGAPVEDLLEQVSLGDGGRRDDHQSGCPHCQAALGEYERIWTPVRELARSEVQPPESLLDDVIARIRDAAADPDYGTLPGPDGTTRISARVVVVTARETAQAIAGVRVALGRLVGVGVTPTTEPTGPESTATSPQAQGPAQPETTGEIGEDELRVVAGISGRSTAVEVTLAADYGTDLVALGESIRAEVAARVRDLTGLDPVAVTVLIDDVFD